MRKEDCFVCTLWNEKTHRSKEEQKGRREKKREKKEKCFVCTVWNKKTHRSKKRGFYRYKEE